MNNTMMSIAEYIATNFSVFGLGSKEDLITIEKPKKRLVNGGKWLIMLPLRTLPDTDFKVPFGNLLANGVRGERFLTMVEFECKTRAPEPEKDFLWNTARKLRDKVYNVLAGPYRGGLTVPRKDWTDPQNPMPAGEIWFEVDPEKNSPIEDPIEDPNDPANKSIFLTYNVHWVRPVT
ncbi:hypothetical protein [Candidatus Formimonas warabiya]|uniref:Uncharacterized protein n=1 Tax=Formimonas warabiya TaxID=1761012 RepID=A0A3G1KP09_FORW1|nr:hypothetical protein [Candidatus Formimonas warabiya]ATW24166.1 hypothetical protein DCMF_04650 [Candidatus Formimonas warabiya]